MSNKKQSSVEWLVEHLIEYGHDLSLHKIEIEQAKAMHKEEIVNTWTEATAPSHEIGLSDTTYILAKIKEAEQYYNETFGGEK